MSILIWFLIGFLIGFLAYSFVIAPIFMELALDKPKKTEDGRLRIKSKGFVIRFFYGVNVMRKIKDHDFCFPKNTCHLYKGIYLGIPCFFLVPSLVFTLASLFFVLIYGVVSPFAVMAGYMPNPVGFVKNESEDLFYPYEEIGDKKWIAPWKFLLPIGLLVLIYFFYREIFVGLVKTLRLLSSNVALIVYGSIAGLIFLIIIVNKIRKTESFAATKETIISFIKKMCKEIEIT